MKRVSILGSTGSVGRATVDLISSQPDSFAVVALTGNSNVTLLAQQAIALRAQFAVTADAGKFAELRQLLSGTDIEAAAGPEALREAAQRPADWMMAAIVGVAGLAPILTAIGQGICVAIANKEPLVAAGPLVMAAARAAGATLLPVDSEHNAVFQVFDAAQRSAIERIILTASGGPFRDWPLERIPHATPAEAVAHPNWAMGAKITVDTATMMNKGLEVIEAHHLFGLSPERIEILLHRQSTIHAMVEYADGSVLAQLGAPDMRTPIAHALAWPARMATTGQRLDLAKPLSLTLEPLDPERFPAARLAYDALRDGPAACIALNAANEVAVEAFLGGAIGFGEIVRIVEATLGGALPLAAAAGLEDILSFDAAMRRRAESHIISRSARRA